MNLEDVEMADSVGKQASLAGKLGLKPQLILRNSLAQSPEVDRERKKKKKD